MNHTVDVRVGFEDRVKILLLANVHLEEIWSLAADELDTIERFLRRVVQIVRNHHFVASIEQGESSKGANVAGSPARFLAIEAVKTGREPHPVTRTDPIAMISGQNGVFVGEKESEGAVVDLSSELPTFLVSVAPYAINTSCAT